MTIPGFNKQHALLTGPSQPPDLYAVHGRDGPSRPGAETDHWEELAFYQERWKAGPISAATCR